MAGHSKWANIQYRKGAQDKKKAKAFSRLSKEIMIAVKMGGPDPDANARLRMAIRSASAESMPKDNIKRAIERVGNSEADYEEIRYEGFAPGGVGLIVEVSTDNRNRAASGVRTAFAKNGGALGETGSVSHGFDQVGEIVLPPEAGDEDTVMDAAIAAGAGDVVSDETGHIIYSSGRDDLITVSAALDAIVGDTVQASSVRLVWRPSSPVDVSGASAEKLLNLLDALDNLDDVQNVFGNFVISDDEMKRIQG